MEAKSSKVKNLKKVAIVGGSGFYDFPELREISDIKVDTPFGDVFAIKRGVLNDVQVYFLARHGAGHRLPPHKINYRANIWALRELGVSRVVSINAVGAINLSMPPGAIVLPDQIIDYTYGREHTFADLISDEFNHVDFTYPFNQAMQKVLAHELSLSDANWLHGGVYGCMQGPRLETAAEINRLERDGCDLVGMTAMPEAALACELGLEYVSICSVANWAAGRSSDSLSFAEISANLQKTSLVIRQLIESAIPGLAGSEVCSQEEGITI